jgi:Glycosyltransferase WbsX
VPAVPESIVGRTRCGVVKWRIEPLASDRPIFEPRRARLLAFYLPQFHPVPENDEFWEPGFTEWTNVVRARPLFPGHRQPRLPGCLGFYDLRVAETRAEQARLARSAGIEGFVYWHYWFGDGRRILERPFTEVLDSGEPDFPFALAWANQSWTGIWHGAPGRMLIEQHYPGDDDVRKHVELLMPAFMDSRYIRVGERPLLVVNSPNELPEPRRFTELVRSLAQTHGLGDLYLVGRDQGLASPTSLGFDAWYDQPPLWPPLEGWPRWRRALLRRLYRAKVARFADTVTAYRATRPRERHHPTILAGWDSTPRSGRQGVVLTGFTPELFGRHCRDVLERVDAQRFEERLVFVKSWNEWAEGNTLEPDAASGAALLDALATEVIGDGVHVGQRRYNGGGTGDA